MVCNSLIKTKTTSLISKGLLNVLYEVFIDKQAYLTINPEFLRVSKV